MSTSLYFKEVETTFTTGLIAVSQIPAHWKLIHYDYDYVAAEKRLNLARRYQQLYDQLDKRFGNLRRSQSWLASQNSVETASLLIAYVEVLSSYLRKRGLHAELLRWCEDGLRACEKLEQCPASLLLLRSQAQHALGLWNEAVASVQAAIEASNNIDTDLYARSVLTLGVFQFNQGDYVTALETLDRAAALPAQQSEYERLATVRSEIAAYYLNKGDLDTALSLYLEVDRLYRQSGANEPANHTLLMLGVVYRKKKEYELAATYLQQLIDRGEAQQHQETVATATHHLAWVYLSKGDTGHARYLCGKTIALYEKIGNARGLSDAYEQLGCTALAERREKDALPHLERSVVIRRQLGNMHGVASSLRRLAIAHLALGHLVAAIRYLWQSLSTYRRLGMLSRQRITTIIRQLFSCLMGQRQWNG